MTALMTISRIKYGGNEKLWACRSSAGQIKISVPRPWWPFEALGFEAEQMYAEESERYSAVKKIGEASLQAACYLAD